MLALAVEQRDKSSAGVETVYSKLCVGGQAGVGGRDERGTGDWSKRRIVWSGGGPAEVVVSGEWETRRSWVSLTATLSYTRIRTANVQESRNRGARLWA